MIKKIVILLLVLSASFQGFSQEFMCKVQVQTPGIQGVDQEIFKSFQTAVTEFMNNRKWSGYNFRLAERIECTFVFTIQEAISTDEFKGTLNVVQQRPVYNTDYNTVLLNMVDKNIHFTYTPNQKMEYVDNSFSSNLTSILAFYAYTMLGLDFDTFSQDGGTAFYQKANDVVNLAQNSGEKGWSAFDGPKNRYQLIENLLNASFNDLRVFYYNYHRLGLDVMSKDVMKGRAKITESLPLLKKVYDKQPGLYLLQQIIQAKRDEMINIYKDADPSEKNTFVTIMKELDPANSSKYNTVMR